MRVKQVDKLMQRVKLVPVKVSPVRVQTDVVVPAVQVVEGPSRASYATVATQASVQVAAPAPVGPVLLPTGASALVVASLQYSNPL